MASAVCGRITEAERAYAWSARTRLPMAPGRWRSSAPRSPRRAWTRTRSPTSRSACGTTGCSPGDARVRPAHVAGGSPRHRVRGGPPAAQRRHRGHAIRTERSTLTRCSPAARASSRHCDVRWRSPNWSMTSSPIGNCCGTSRARGRRAPGCLSGQVELLDGLVLPGARRSRPGRVRRAGARVVDGR